MGLFIKQNIGESFVEIPVWSLEQIYEDSDCTIPLIFILSPGSDPKSQFDRFVEQKKIKNLNIISLGRG